MVRSVLRLRPRAGDARAVLDFYVAREILERALADGGCASVEMHLRLPQRDEVVVSALWDSAADYEAWAGSAARSHDLLDLEALLAPDSLPVAPADLYEVVANLGEAS